MKPIVGVDLGTSYSSVAVWTEGGIQVLTDENGHTSQPSVVSYVPEIPPLVGFRARERLVTDPHNTVYSFKRLLGRPFNSPEVRIACTGFPYHVIEGPQGQAMIRAGGRRMTVPSVAADLLAHLGAIMRRHLGTEVEELVVTVPSNATEVQREATQTACQLARLKAVRMINEPTAAALAFGYGTNWSGTVAVYDFGGGTFDFTVLDIQAGLFRVLGTAGDAFLGGDDIDQALAKYVSSHFWQATQVDLTHSAAEWQRLLWACEQAKRELSVQPSARVYLPDVAQGDDGPVHLDGWVTREMLELVSREFVDRTLAVCDQALRDANLSPAQLDAVVLVGGTTLMPLVRQAVQEFFGRTPDTRMDPLTAVAAGAAIQALMLRGMPLGTTQATPLLLDVTPHTVVLVTEGTGLLPVIARNSPIPTENEVTLATWQDGQTEMVLQVLQGEAPSVRGNTLVGTLNLKGLPPAPRGQVRVRVTVAVDSDGRLRLTAVLPETGRVWTSQHRLVADHAYFKEPA